PHAGGLVRGGRAGVARPGGATTGNVGLRYPSNGANLCGMDDDRSVDTTMGLTALDGLVMGTRCGRIDPGARLLPATAIRDVRIRAVASAVPLQRPARRFRQQQCPRRHGRSGWLQRRNRFAELPASPLPWRVVLLAYPLRHPFEDAFIHATPEHSDECCPTCLYGNARASPQTALANVGRGRLLVERIFDEPRRPTITRV
ncbi:MAG: hypothetical protein ABI178_13545, partial [Rhodanobacter sp.]